MRLADFILDKIEVIVAEWQAFAATQTPAAADMTPLALRNDAADILKAIARDISTPQSRHEQAQKAKGRAPRIAGAPETAAQTHAVMRARSGFDINQLIAEYRALRASVLRLWLDAVPLDGSREDEIIRFNEAIDQAVAESVGHFHAEMERSRNLLLGMLGHDMRTPLNAIVATASYLTAINAGDHVTEAAERLIRSGASIRDLLDDLVDFSRTQLGVGIRIEAADVDLAAELGDELDLLRTAHADARIDLSVSGSERGCWDSRRVRQIVRNLVSNAVEHGAPKSPVRVSLTCAEDEAVIEVSNHGGAIDPSIIEQMFQPLRRGQSAGGQGRSEHLGLGLFIVRIIAEAHGGEVGVRSDGSETAFQVRLPRIPPAA